MSFSRIIVFVVLFIFSVAIRSADASIEFVISRAALAGEDFVDWGDLGPAFTQVSNPFNISSNGSAVVTVSKTQAGNFDRRDQGNGWGGGFVNGERLLWTQDQFSYPDANNPDVISLAFGGNGISAGGAHIDADAEGSFTAMIEAFDASDVSLGSFTGTSVGNAALFLGVRNTMAPIFSIEFSIVTADSLTSSFALNQFDFTAIPEPTTAIIWGIGLAAVGCAVRRVSR